MASRERLRRWRARRSWFQRELGRLGVPEPLRRLPRWLQVQQSYRKLGRAVGVVLIGQGLILTVLIATTMRVILPPLAGSTDAVILFAMTSVMHYTMVAAMTLLYVDGVDPWA